jgi:hypothetical protein
MGGGSKRSGDVTKGAPGNPLTGSTEGFGESPEGAYSYCQQEHWLSFRLASGANPKPGTEVRLVAANPVQLLAGSTLIGDLDPRQSVSMRGCMESGYHMRGAVRSADLTTRGGVAVLRGEPPE